MRSNLEIFVNWNIVYNSGIATTKHEELFVQVTFWWSIYDGGRFFLAPTPILFDYLSSILMFNFGCSLLLRNEAANHLITVMMSHLTSTLVDGASA